jgi:hypothetical protein
MPRRVLRLLMVVLGLLALHTTAARAALTLQDVIDAGSIVIDDKTFSDFVYTATGDMPSATNVGFIPFDTAFNPGFRLTGAFTDNIGGGGSDAFLSYTVTVNPGGAPIIDAELAGNPGLVPPGSTGSISVEETFLPTFPNLHLSISDVNGVINNSDHINFPFPVTQLFVQKNILASAVTGIPVLSFIDQRFSESVVPEPCTAHVVCGVTLLGAGASFLRRRKKARA